MGERERTGGRLEAAYEVMISCAAGKCREEDGSENTRAGM